MMHLCLMSKQGSGKNQTLKFLWGAGLPVKAMEGRGFLVGRLTVRWRRRRRQVKGRTSSEAAADEAHSERGAASEGGVPPTPPCAMHPGTPGCRTCARLRCNSCRGHRCLFRGEKRSNSSAAKRTREEEAPSVWRERDIERERKRERDLGKGRGRRE